jgi:hypothetical protein
MGFWKIAAVRPGGVWRHSAKRPDGSLEMVYAYDFWTDEPLFQDPPFYFVRASIGRILQEAGLTGFALRSIPTIRAKEWLDPENKDRPLEDVQHLEIAGRAGDADFGLQHTSDLIISDRALELLRQHGLKPTEIEPYDPDDRIPATIEEFWERRRERVKRKQIDKDTDK